VSDQPTTVGDESAPASNTWVPASGSGTLSGLSAKVDERPELAVGGAFAGGMLLALILKRLAR
jgi:hypothetical protein